MSTHSPQSISSSSSLETKNNRMQISTQATPTTKPASYTPTHHIGAPPTSFKNPWPSSPPPYSWTSILRARFFNSAERNFIPVPTDRSLLVPVVTPDWGASNVEAPSKLKATWIGHASFLVEFPSVLPGQRGVRVLLDPVFSERMSPVSFLGPKRFTPPPCTLEELPEVDAVCISHNHYDHLDTATIQFVRERGKGTVRFMCGLGVGSNLMGMGVGKDEIIEMDWWDSIMVSVKKNEQLIGEVKVICTPSQHNSGRGINDHAKTLWCSFVLIEGLQKASGALAADANDQARAGKRLFFGGDTAYRAIPQGATDEEISKLPVCTAFGEVGQLYGPFDLALLPIGCYSPRWWMSAVHCAPEDSICIHKDIRSRKSIGMHYGTLRGGISQYYEAVTEPPERWKESCEKAGLKWQDEIDVMAVGATVLV